MATAAEVINAFLENFNYVYKSGDNQGKRTGFKPFFFNENLTSALEAEAGILAIELSTLATSDKDDAEKINTFFTAVQTHVKNAWDKRDKLSPVTHKTHALDHDMHSGLPPSVIREYDYHRAYPAGRFESQIVKGLKAAENGLDGEALAKCQKLITDVESYNPQASVWNVRVTRI